MIIKKTPFEKMRFFHVIFISFAFAKVLEQ